MSRRATLLGMIAIAAVSFRAFAWTECTRPLFASSARNVVIQSEITRARLSMVAGARRSKTELVLRNIQFDAHPGTQFHVFLERIDDPAKRARVGTLSFYMAAKGRVTTSRTFDVTDELHQLATADLGAVNVVFEATTGRGGANSKAGFNAQSKLTIGEIELRLKATK